MSTKQDSIRELAYHLWQQRGHRHGSSEQDWLDAERQLHNGATSGPEPTRPGNGNAQSSVDQALNDSFPASDPPASHLADVPPVNASTRGRQRSKK